MAVRKDVVELADSLGGLMAGEGCYPSVLPRRRSGDIVVTLAPRDAMALIEALRSREKVAVA